MKRLKIILLFSFLFPLGFIEGKSTDSTTDRVALELVEPAGRGMTISNYPISVGLIFPKGEVTSLPGGRVVDDMGDVIPFEAEATGWWEKEKQNVKWLLLRFKASTDRKYFFEPGKKAQLLSGDPIASRNGESITVDAGAIQVSMNPAQGGLFEKISLHGQPIASSEKKDFVLSIDDGSQPVPLTLADWQMTIEEANSARACIKMTGFWKDAQGTPLAHAQVRCHFFKGETFVRIEHTLTWMIKDIKYGIRELSLAVASSTGPSPEIQVGVGDHSAETVVATLPEGSSVEAYQENGKRFVIKEGDKVLKEGKNLAGWISEKGSDKRSVAMSLRHAWQRYPVTFRAEAGRIQTQFSPKQERLSFEQEAIMTPGIYNHPSWLDLRKQFKAPTDVAYFFDNYSPMTDHGYFYTAEGAAFTHELTLSFHDAKTPRSVEELNSVNQFPLVARQDANQAMRVPFMGMDILAYDPKQPEIERAVSQLGKIAMGRWIDTMNFGLTRFGMVRWGKHGSIEDPSTTFYRWMDNVQYSQQLIPWLLHMRGGERRFYDDAIIVGRYAMDMSVNHYTTRPDCPTGHMTGAGSSLPFNPFPFSTSDAKLQKVHFLSYYYHLTGDKRAKEVMDEVIAGTKQFALEEEARQREKHPDKKYYYLAAGGRENYNMNIFWANAWDETFDPEIWRLAENNRMCTIYGEYKANRNYFESPRVYIYEGLLAQDQRNPDKEAREVMLKYLKIEALKTHGGIPNSVEDTIAFPWAYEQTKDPLFAEAAWDVARGAADLVSETNFEAEKVPDFYPYEYLGNALYRQHLLPILTGATLGKKMGYDWKKKAVYRDTFFVMWKRPGEQDFQAEAFVRARKDGPLKIMCLLEGDIKNPPEIEVVRANGTSVTKFPVKAKRNQPVVFQGDISIDDAKEGDVFKVKVRKADQAPLAIVSEGQVVHHLPLDLKHGQKSMSEMQAYTPLRFVTRTISGTFSYFNGARRPYTLRDAETQELIFRPKFYNVEESNHPSATGKMIMVTSGDSPNLDEWLMKGVESYFSVTKDDWFQPEEAGWPKEPTPVVVNKP